MGAFTGNPRFLHLRRSTVHSRTETAWILRRIRLQAQPTLRHTNIGQRPDYRNSDHTFGGSEDLRRERVPDMTFFRPDLEMHCIRPGHWMVEGYHIERIQRTRWEVTSRFAGHPTISHGTEATLTDACVLVWELLCTRSDAH